MYADGFPADCGLRAGCGVWRDCGRLVHGLPPRFRGRLPWYAEILRQIGKIPWENLKIPRRFPAVSLCVLAGRFGGFGAAMRLVARSVPLCLARDR